MSAGHKFNARRTKYKDEWYPSEAEARRAMELDALKAAGEILRWARAKPIELVPRVGKQRAVTYTADFWVQSGNGTWFEDVKGVETPVFKLKAKLLAWRYPDLELRVLKG